ncbi:MAG: T9SS type A sorting domain-containing protein [Flavobacteriales bacterium]|nr:T9SS type A sorting domain-containing protein [Flavobacteriales bacterium]
MGRWPQPYRGTVQHTDQRAIQLITVSSVDGRIVWNERNLNTNSASIDLDAQPSGLYTVRCESGNTSNVVRVVKDYP